MKGQDRAILAAVAMGLAGGVASAQTVINMSGATLLRNFLIAPASTQDYIDVDGDGFARRFGTNDQLAPFALPPSPGLGQNLQWWIVQYRSVGSVNGFQELVDYGGPGFTGGTGAGPIRTAVASQAFSNRNEYIRNGACNTPFYNEQFPGGAPVTSDVTTLQAVWVFPGAGSPCNPIGAPPPPNTGIRIDMAPVDVPSLWAVQDLRPGTPSWDRRPGSPRYGTNPLRSVNTQGTSAGANYQNVLASLGPRNLYRPGVTPDSNTIFDTKIAYAPIAVVTNLGVGLSEILLSDLQHLSVTGRRRNGENLIFVTRDSGSGTRNGFQNSICVDPSWGSGENVGDLSVLASWNLAGPDFVPSNKSSNAEVEPTVQNARLAIGYAGAERGVNSPGWLVGGRLEVLGVINDNLGGVVPARPTIDNVLDNGPNGYNIGGPSIFASIGDPLAEPVANGGQANGNPRMPNTEAAKYLNNVTASIAAFNSNPGGDPTLFTPGEFLAINFILVQAQDLINDTLDPCTLLPNPELNQFLQDFTRANNVLRHPAYATFGTVTLNGKVPSRLVGHVYTDGVPGGQYYIDQNGARVDYGTNLTSRNRIAGDFNGDGVRNLDDIPGMIAAWRERNGGPNWNPPSGTGPIAGAPGSDLVFEIVGDFNADGNFDAKDVRYFADGLAIVNGILDRREGFTRVDLAFGGNFFGTTKATGAAYQPGDSRADVAGAPGQAPGWAPVGADGVIDARDIDYVYAQFRRNPAVTDGELNWDVLSEAGALIGSSRADLSCDINGDLKVNQADVCELVQVVLGTSFGDVNLDGVVDGADLAIINANLGLPGGWAQGDMDGDGMVTTVDLDIAMGLFNLCCPADWNNDGVVDFNDLLAYFNDYNAGSPRADLNGDGVVDFNDFLQYLNYYNTPC